MLEFKGLNFKQNPNNVEKPEPERRPPAAAPHLFRVPIWVSLLPQGMCLSSLARVFPHCLNSVESSSP